MCVAAFAWRAHPDWHLVAIGNRDEYHQRPAAPLAHWKDREGVIAGPDLQSGGTWLGVSEQGQFVLVTNLRGYGQPDPSRKSRGELVTDLLTDQNQTLDMGSYNPFNIIHASRDEARFLTNRPDHISANLSRGVYGLSNGQLDEPWAKTVHLKTALFDWLWQSGSLSAPLFDALGSENLPSLGLQPRLPSDMPLEAQETPAFIRNPVYGTRCSTVVTVNKHGHGRILERRFDASGEKTGETALEFSWPG
ncbi:NRDE family protein [Altererythrobacter ishigakiensis]|uniref:Uncharacterized protein with NRDE domain n=1 Tax=Altererythrobacter ishigakiensis TaxID=476157 RepID=A0A562UXA3_9SPHN|nr:NRDE family protein [Altererythrobacter ishigakiensis]TWJ10284.1 uncharacterized protein with NRDE domain [Altererythrobacter ishigakiensis]